MKRKIETVIVGAGQAGLSVSYYLNQTGREHVILEQEQLPVHAWRAGRWDSFTLVTPNWSFLVPGAEYDGPDPDGFMNREEIIQHFDQYLGKFAFPLECGIRVNSVDVENGGYLVQTSDGDWQSRNVVIATGIFQTPRVPLFSKELPAGIFQIHSGQYRNPQQLPPGAVLVVGSSQSGTQITEELYQGGREVYLCISKTGRVPRRYREKDIFSWLLMSGFFNRTIANLPTREARFNGNPHVTGKNGGHTLNLHQFSRDGVHLLGKVASLKEEDLLLAPDLKENLTKSDQFEQMVKKQIDEFIEKHEMDVPEETLPDLRDGYNVPEVLTLNLKNAGIKSIIWAMGYQFDYSLVHLPVFDEAGYPVVQSGETSSPGLYFVGLPWLPSMKTGILLGVKESAQSVAEKIG